MHKLAHILGLASFFLSPAVWAAGDAQAPKKINWEHGGIFGTFDRAAVQRGFQVYREVCSGCHGLKYIAFRNLLEIGLNEEQAKSIAKEYTVMDGPDDEGEMFERPAKLSDYMPSPFDNEKAARASNNGAYPPDLSLIVKARPGGENYLYSLLTGYSDPPSGVDVAEDMSYNPYFPGKQIAMAAPIDDESVDYADGTNNSREQISKDVVTFLSWASEPTLEARKKMGVKVILYLIILTIVLYMIKRRVWSDLH